MPMKIKFLGTSAGWPLPRLGCICQICTSIDPKDTRTRTQLLVNDSILIDTGPDTYAHLKSLDFIDPSGFQNDKRGATKIKAILVSHEHLDHIEGFWDISHIYNGHKQIEIFITSPLVSPVRQYIGSHEPHLKIKVVKPNEPFTIDHIKVEYFPVVHGKTPAFGIKLKENKIFVYISDFNRIIPSQQKIVKYADYWAIDGSSLGKIGQGPGHISIQDGIQISKKLKIKNTYFVHIGHKTGTHQFLEEYLRENAGPNFHIAYDGQEINL